MRRRRAVRACSSCFTSRWTVFERRRRCATTRSTGASCSQEQQDPPRRDPRRRRHGAGALACSGAGDTLRAPLPDRRRCSRTPVGYSYTTLGRAGLERSHNDELTGRARRARDGARVDRSGTRQRGRRPAHDARPAARSRSRIDALERPATRARVVALDRETGARAGDGLASRATTRTGSTTAATFARAEPRRGERAAGQPRDAGRLPAGLDVQGRHRGRGARQRQVHARLARRRRATASRSPACRCNNFGGEDFGDDRPHHALTNSVNTVWAEVGEELGERTMQQLHGALRLLRRAAARLPRRADVGLAACASDGELHAGRPSDSVDVGRVAIGQGDLLVTPLQMAMVAADGRQRRRADGAAPRATASSTPTAARSSEIEPRRPSR